MQKPLDGKRIFLVEDELMAALDLSDMIADLGAQVVGPIARLDDAMRRAREQAVDGAVLDVKLDSQLTTPLVLFLRNRGVPVVLSTGYERGMLPQELADLPRLTKPYDERSLRRAMEGLFKPTP